MTLAAIEGPLRMVWLGVLVVLAVVWAVLHARAIVRLERRRLRQSIVVRIVADPRAFVEATERAAAAMRRFGVAASQSSTAFSAMGQAMRAHREVPPPRRKWDT